MAYIDAKNEHTVVIDGALLRSHALAVNLAEVHRVFPFVATCGRELTDWAKSKNDIVERFWADTVADHTLHYAVKFMEKQFR